MRQADVDYRTLEFRSIQRIASIGFGMKSAGVEVTANGQFMSPAGKEDGVSDLIETYGPGSVRRTFVTLVKTAETTDALETKAVGRALGQTTRRIARRVEPYDPNAEDGDGDGEVQDGSTWARPARAVRRVLARTLNRAADTLDRRARQTQRRNRTNRSTPLNQLRSLSKPERIKVLKLLSDKQRKLANFRRRRINNSIDGLKDNREELIALRRRLLRVQEGIGRRHRNRMRSIGRNDPEELIRYSDIGNAIDRIDGHLTELAQTDRNELDGPERDLTPDAPSSPNVPEASDVPSAPATPAAPETPRTPPAPSVAPAPRVPQTPQTPDAPTVPSTPRTPSQPRQRGMRGRQRLFDLAKTFSFRNRLGADSDYEKMLKATADKDWKRNLKLRQQFWDSLHPDRSFEEDKREMVADILAASRGYAGRIQLLQDNKRRLETESDLPESKRLERIKQIDQEIQFLEDNIRDMHALAYEIAQLQSDDEDRTPIPDSDLPPAPDPSPGPRPNPSPGPRPNPSPGPRPNPSPGPRPDPSPGPRPNPSPGPRPDPSPGPRPDPSPGPRPDPSPGPRPDITPTPDDEMPPTGPLPENRRDRIGFLQRLLEWIQKKLDEAREKRSDRRQTRQSRRDRRRQAVTENAADVVAPDPNGIGAAWRNRTDWPGGGSTPTGTEVDVTPDRNVTEDVIPRRARTDQQEALEEAQRLTREDGKRRAVFRTDSADGFAIVEGDENIQRAGERYGDPLYMTTRVAPDGPTVDADRPTEADVTPDPNGIGAAWRNRTDWPGGRSAPTGTNETPRQNVARTWGVWSPDDDSPYVAYIPIDKDIADTDYEIERMHAPREIFEVVGPSEGALGERGMYRIRRVDKDGVDEPEYNVPRTSLFRPAKDQESWPTPEDFDSYVEPPPSARRGPVRGQYEPEYDNLFEPPPYESGAFMEPGRDFPDPRATDATPDAAGTDLPDVAPPQMAPEEPATKRPRRLPGKQFSTHRAKTKEKARENALASLRRRVENNPDLDGELAIHELPDGRYEVVSAARADALEQMGETVERVGRPSKKSKKKD